MDAVSRIELLRKDAIDPVVGFHLWNLRFNRHFLALDPALPLEDRYAEAYAVALQQAEVSISPEELIVGKADTPLTEQETAELWTLEVQTHQCSIPGLTIMRQEVKVEPSTGLVVMVMTQSADPISQTTDVMILKQEEAQFTGQPLRLSHQVV